MAMNKTRPTVASVAGFLAQVEPESRREDARRIAAMMESLSGEPPRMWGPAIIGFGSYHYRYESGREGDAPRIGFSPRKGALVLYLVDGFPRHAELLARLGRHQTGKSCLYIKALADIDMEALEALVRGSIAWMDDRYPR